MEYDNTNRGMLMKNQNKTADNHPDYSGSLNVNGVDHWLSGWLKESKNGNKFFSLSVKPKEQKSEPKPKKQVEEDPNDPIPF
jgi:uncharacterized protein (DUF736 family)